MPSLRVATWNVAGARREATAEVHLEAVLATVRALGADLLALQEVDRELGRSGRVDQPKAIAEALGPDWSWSYAPALVGDNFQPLSGPDPGGPAYGNLLLSRRPLQAVEHRRFPPAGGGEQRTALVATIQIGSHSLTVAGAHLSNKQGHNVRQLRELQRVMARGPAPRLLLGDFNLSWAAVLVASRWGWREVGRGDTFPNSRPNRQLDHVLRNDPAGMLRPSGAWVAAAPVSDHRPLIAELEVAAP
ncbi:MAG TPA: endonuclease/exonuclease/phosphatase family protein [Actinomycetes bacterium]|jgi:endonuclease/exonuclease/phosphatase family metal-dependent hydrolase|nr:endonuclease/exonuclease/phosphatase family protein [Actinomycetes bacterium]